MFGKRMTKKRCFCHLWPNITGSPAPVEPITIDFVPTDIRLDSVTSIPLIVNILLVSILVNILFTQEIPFVAVCVRPFILLSAYIYRVLCEFLRYMAYLLRRWADAPNIRLSDCPILLRGMKSDEDSSLLYDRCRSGIYENHCEGCCATK